jgi:hypothetical protein
MRKFWLVLAVFSILALGSLGAAPQAGVQDTTWGYRFQNSPLASPGTIRGYVFRDSNQNSVFDADEEGIPDVYITVSYGDYQHTYYTGGGDPNGNVPGPGSYGPTPLQSGYWTVTLHVPDGYRSTTPTELLVLVPGGGAATGADFGIYGSGPISYSSGTGVGMGGGAGAGTLPQTGGVTQTPRGHLVALLVALVGFLALLGTPWCITKVKRAHSRWW